MWKCKEWCYIQLTFGIWCGLLNQHPLSPARHNPKTFTSSTQRIIQKETKNPEKRSNFCQVLLYCVGLRTQNPGLREVDLEPSPKRGTGKINRLRQGRKKQHNTSRIVHPVLSNETLALRELDLEPSAKRKTNRTEALANLYW